ncbi:MAG TPA: transglutaminase domain-containing protein [Thermotogota bacterium]|nr:transglutaminase domain-containing protein [Thermotogota bacterium]HNT96375.1 transglutaminase domain-containing protein [Thermotogota bacterium]
MRSKEHGGFTDAPFSGETPNTLVKKLTNQRMKEGEKCRAIFDWIARHIQYDVQAYRRKHYANQDASSVLRTRKAVCAGYANLFQSMVKEAGIETVTISGYVKGFGFSVGDPMPRNQSNHAWNAARIANTWQLVDCTWGAGFINGDDRYQQWYEPFYFCPPPQQFIYSHFPNDPQWQLLRDPVTPKAFINLPQVWPDFFKRGITLLNAPHGNLNAHGALKLRFWAPENACLSAVLIDPGNNKFREYTFSQREDNEYAIMVAFRQTGIHALEVYARDRVDDDPNNPDERVSSVILKYSIKAVSCDPNAPSFPATYGTFDDYNVQVECPLRKTLSAGRVERFRIKVPGAKEAHVNYGKTWHPMRSSKGWFETQLTVPLGPIQILARFPRSKQHWTLLQYDGA